MRSAPFDLDGDDRGILCIHGFTGAPEGLRYLGERLAGRGFSVSAVLLPGHGTRVEDLEAVTWQDWVAHVEGAYDRLAAKCSQVAVVGQSMGGLLALHLAIPRAAGAARGTALSGGSGFAVAGKAAAVATLATPLWLGGLAARVARWTQPGGWLAGRVRFLPKIGGADVRDPDAKKSYYGYNRVPAKSIGELLALMADVERRLDQVRAPVLVLHGRRDHTVPFACAAAIAAKTRAERVRALDRSFHLLASDVERDLVAAEVGEFVDRHLKRS